MINKLSKTKKSTTLSSRIDSNIYENLVDLAKSKGVSMNSLINSILKRHLIWDQFSEDMGLIPITKRTLKKNF